MVFGWFPWFFKVSRWIFIVINGPRLVKSELSAAGPKWDVKNDGNDDEDDNDDGDEDEDEDSENDAIQISSTAVYSQACIRERGPTESHTETPITNLSTRIFWSLDKDKV